MVSPVENRTLAPLSFQDRHSLLLDRLKGYITHNHLQPGDKLPTEEVLGEQLGVSRTAVREALRGLEALGIVQAQQGVGRIVMPFSFEPVLEALSYGLTLEDYSVLQVTDIRKSLDAYFIELSIANITEAQIEALDDIVKQMRRRNEADEDMEREDHAFHEVLYRACGNPLALQLFEITWRVRLAALSKSAALKEMPPGTVEEHAELLEAIKAQDVGLARNLVVGHHWNIEQRFRRALELELLPSGSSSTRKGGGDPRGITD